MTITDTSTVIPTIEEKLTQALTANFVVHDRGETHLDMFAHCFEDEISSLQICEFNESDIGLGVEVCLSDDGEISISTRLRESRDEWNLEEHEITPVLKAIERLAVTAVDDAHRQALRLRNPDSAPDKAPHRKMGPRFSRSASKAAKRKEPFMSKMAI
ncbi:hypothetical protein [Roseibium aggregatum]|uniref:Uncharacterized protein n=1 Tax=Roseibium aggregatum TaxID=187304 RepID=A0A0M6YC60_9HYPH|nr:hypothetical protein [Roseibium aggregatum]CTQ47294.1 hypothetical protein LAL4801_05756 [Roseibium aggregatum]